MSAQGPPESVAFFRLPASPAPLVAACGCSSAGCTGQKREERVSPYRSERGVFGHLFYGGRGQRLSTLAGPCRIERLRCHCRENHPRGLRLAAGLLDLAHLDPLLELPRAGFFAAPVKSSEQVELESRDEQTRPRCSPRFQSLSKGQIDRGCSAQRPSSSGSKELCKEDSWNA